MIISEIDFNIIGKTHRKQMLNICLSFKGQSHKGLMRTFGKSGANLAHWIIAPELLSEELRGQVEDWIRETLSEVKTYLG